MFLSTRVFLVGNPYLILKEGEGFELHFLIPTFGQASSCWAEKVVLLDATTEELTESFFGLFFGGDLVYSLEEQQRRLPGIISDIWL